jgi:dTDP-4-amino-4,6-dideoxygalactose transaminase
MIPLFKVFMSKEAEDVSSVLSSGYIGQGKYVEQFEEKLREYFNNPYVVTVNSGTSALSLAARLVKNRCKKKEEHKFLSTPLTCFATNSSLLQNGYNLHWIDSMKNAPNMSFNSLQDIPFNENMDGLMLVHWGGGCHDLDKFRGDTYCQSIYLIEDCAHAFGTKYNGRQICDISQPFSSETFQCYSFQAIKNLTTVDGGCLVCHNEDAYNEARLLRWFGIDRSGAPLDSRINEKIKDWGYKYHMNDVNAFIGLKNLPYVENNINLQREHVLTYEEKINWTPGIIQLYEEDPKCESSCWLYTVRIPNNRDNFIKYMKDKGIQVSQVHTRNDTQPVFNKLKTYGNENLTNMSKIEQEMISIPCGWWLSKQDESYIIETINNWNIND